MTESVKTTSNNKLLEIVEIVSVVGSVGGAIASAVIPQAAAFAALPLSLTVALSFWNRKQLLNELSQNNQTAIVQLTKQLEGYNQNNQNAMRELGSSIKQQNIDTEANFGTLTEQLEQFNQSNQTAFTQIQQQHAETQNKISQQGEQQAKLQQIAAALSQETINLQASTQLLDSKQTQTAQLASYLQEISTFTQATRLQPNYAEGYYKRGMTYQQMGYQEGAIGDYTEAIRVNPNYAEAYFSRGMLRAELGSKKAAVEDLREATKHFFEKGDMSNYQAARDLSKQFHELNSQIKGDASGLLAISSLFSD